MDFLAGDAWNYQKIKAEAAERRKAGLPYKTVKDLIVLSTQNDPFYSGTDTDTRNAEWFADLWERFGYQQGVHLRRVHYRVVSQEMPVTMPDGKPYENTDVCWQFLIVAAKKARYLGLVDPAAFDDRRVQPPVIKYEPEGSGVEIDIDGYDFDDNLQLPEMPEFPEYRVHARVDQPYQVEIWTEKSTMNDILLPLCEKYRVNLVAGVGEISITQPVLLMQRLANTKKPCRILYVSDFDPAGLSMPVAAARKIEFYARNNGGNLDIELYPVVLTHQQCLDYKLPRSPIKETERRAGAFEGRWGSGATELDALESLYPGELKKILESYIKQFHDEELHLRVKECENNMQRHLDGIADDVRDEYREIFDDLAREYRQLREDIQDRVQGLNERTGRLMQDIEEELYSRMPAYTDDILPEVESPGAMPEEPLFDSSREYMDQLQHYKFFQGVEIIGG